MKNSLTKKIITRIIAFLTVSLIIVSIILFFVVRNTVINNQLLVANRTLDMVRNSIRSYTLLNDVCINDDAFSTGYEETAKMLCNKYDIDFIYLYNPDFKNNTLQYVFIYGNENTIDRIPKYYKDTVTDGYYSDEAIMVWNGQKDYVSFNFDNKYGHELGISSIIEDLDGHKLYIGLDISYSEIYHKILIWFASCILFTLIFSILCEFSIYRSMKKLVVAPARNISKTMNEYATKDCLSNIQLEVKGNDEFAMIAESFNKMTNEIKSYINNIEILSKEQQKQHAEMNVAENIQRGLLPNSEYMDCSLKIKAMMKPAKDVGGDLYDYFEIDNDNLLLVIADVSGKGITAAMFMSMTLTLIRQLAKMGKAPDEILTLANATLSQNNPQMMFVTAFVVIYNKSSQTLTYSNAGHNLPYILRDKELLTLDAGKGVPLGMFEDEEYSPASITLYSGDIFFMYTDGVNEAVNENKEFFGITKLEETIKSFDETKDLSLIDYVYSAITSFSLNAYQSDDITMLSMKIVNSYHLLLDAEQTKFTQIKSAIIDSSIPKKYKLKLCLACEEWFDNICMYSYNNTDDNTDKKLGFTLEVSDKIKIVFEDWGKKYNPLEQVISKDEYDIDNQVGGLGKLIIMSIADKVDYEYLNNKNVLTIIKYIEEE